MADIKQSLGSRSFIEYSIYSSIHHTVLFRTLQIDVMIEFCCVPHIIITIDRKSSVLRLWKHHVLPSCSKINNRFNIIHNILGFLLYSHKCFRKFMRSYEILLPSFWRFFLIPEKSLTHYGIAEKVTLTIQKKIDSVKFE